MIDTIKSILSYKYAWAMLIVGLIIFFVCNYYFTPLLAFAGGLLAAGSFAVFVNYIDDKLLGSVNTKEQIVDFGNIAYAIYFLSLVIGCALVYCASFIVFLAFIFAK